MCPWDQHVERCWTNQLGQHGDDGGQLGQHGQNGACNDQLMNDEA